MSVLLDSLLDRARRDQCEKGDIGQYVIKREPGYMPRIGPYPRPEQPSIGERDEWERGVMTFEARGEIRGPILGAFWRGYRAAQAAASARTLEAAS